MGMNIYNKIKILSDGDKIVLINGGQSYALFGACITSVRWNISQPIMDVTAFGDLTRRMINGPAYTTLDLTMVGGLLEFSEKSDIFNPEKIAKYTKQITGSKRIGIKKSTGLLRSIKNEGWIV